MSSRQLQPELGNSIALSRQHRFWLISVKVNSGSERDEAKRVQAVSEQGLFLFPMARTLPVLTQGDGGQLVETNEGERFYGVLVIPEERSGFSESEP